MKHLDNCKFWLKIYKKNNGEILHDEPYNFYYPEYNDSTIYFQTEILPEILEHFNVTLSDIEYTIE
tara:strand:- start:290 stop:487 length:198 start_codon:yes stop_codon:yes gene_type:complete